MSLTVSPAEIVGASRSPLLATPDSWPRRPLGEVATIVNGFAFKSKQFVPGGGRRPLIRIRDIFNETTSVGYAGEYEEKYIVQPGQLIVGMDGDFNCTRWRGPEALLNQRLCKIVPDEEQLDLDFLTFILPGYLEAIHHVTSSTTVTHLSSRDVARIPIPVPLLREQRAIARLSGTVSTMQQSSASHLASAARAVQRFRLAALAAAHETAVGAAGNDGAVPLASLLREPLKNGYSARPVSHETPFRVLTLTSTTTGRFDSRHFKYTDEVFGEDSPLWLAPGDILVQRGNTAEFVGVPALYEGKAGEFLYPDLMIRVRVRPDVSPRFVWYMLLAPRARSYLRARATGSAGNMPKINQEILAGVRLPLPALEAQEQVVRKLDVAFALVDAVERRIATTSVQVEQSSRSVLGKILRGELAASEVVD